MPEADVSALAGGVAEPALGGFDQVKPLVNASATDATQYAWEGDQVVGEAQNSVCTRYLLQGLRTGAADTDQDGRITLDELYDYVYDKVVNATPKQTPGKWSYKQQGELVIAHNPHPLPGPVAEPAVLPATEQPGRPPVAPRPTVRSGVPNRLPLLIAGLLL